MHVTTRWPNSRKCLALAVVCCVLLLVLQPFIGLVHRSAYAFRGAQYQTESDNNITSNILKPGIGNNRTADSNLEHGNNSSFGNNKEDVLPSKTVQSVDSQAGTVSSGIDSIEREVSNISHHRATVTHLAFLKVHKTGSTTLQNIFMRFGNNLGLTFILGSVTHNECGGWPNCISFYNTITEHNIVPPPKDKTFDILCSHVVYDKVQFGKYLPSDTRSVGIVREPVHRLESAISWFKLLQGVALYTFANNPTRYNNAMLNNRMAFEFGYSVEWFPTENRPHPTTDEMKMVSEYTKEIINDFELILVTERLDESLVLMKRMLHWKTKDILYSNKNSKAHSSFGKESAEKLRQYLYLDYSLYDYAQQELDKKINKTGPGFYEEVEEFKTVLKRVRLFCSIGMTGSILTISGYDWIEDFTTDKQFCSDLLRGEITYTELIRRRQYGKLNTY